MSEAPDNILRLVHGGSGTTSATAPNPGAVALLRDMLERAESGELQSLVIIGIHHEGGEDKTGTGIAVPVERHEQRHVLLLGGPEVARARVLEMVEK